MGDLRNKAKKLADDAKREDRERRRREGWTVFHFDLKPNLTQRDLTIGEAIRHLLRVTGHKVGFWRCPVRGLAIQYKRLPTTRLAYDYGETWIVLHFSRQEDLAAAKRELVIDMLLQGINLYRALPNAVFDEQVRLLKGLLRAPPSTSKEEWLAGKARLHKPFQPLLDTHHSDLRTNLLGKAYTGPTGPARIGITLVDRHV